MGAEEMEYSSSTWSDMIQVYADAKKYDVLRRVHNAIVVETRSIVMTVETSRGTRKGDIINCKL